MPTSSREDFVNGLMNYRLTTELYELLSKVVYGFVMRRRDPGVLH